AEGFQQRIGRSRIGDGVARAGKGAETQLDQLISPVADRHLQRIQAEPERDRLARGCGRRARVEPQRVGRRVLDRRQDFRRWRHGRLVGVELAPALAVRWLLAWDVWLAALEALPDERLRHR